MTISSSYPYNIVNGTPNDASQVMANFNQIQTDVNNNAANAGVNSNITQLAGLATAITIAQGGTGQTTATAGFNALAASGGTIGGALTVSGAVTASSTMSITGVTTHTGGSIVGPTAYVSGKGISQVYGNVAGGNPVTSGTTDANNVQSWKAGTVELRLGPYASGSWWLQATATGNYATTFDFYLNPSGGNVNVPTVGTASDSSTKAASTAFVQAAIAAVFGGANQSLTTNGYQKLPGGFILEWGDIGSVADNSTTTVSIPLAAPNAILSCWAFVNDAFAAGAAEFNTASAVPLSTTQISIKHNTGPTVNASDTVRYVVLCW